MSVPIQNLRLEPENVSTLDSFKEMSISCVVTLQIFDFVSFIVELLVLFFIFNLLGRGGTVCVIFDQNVFIGEEPFNL